MAWIYQAVCVLSAVSSVFRRGWHRGSPVVVGGWWDMDIPVIDTTAIAGNVNAGEGCHGTAGVGEGEGLSRYGRVAGWDFASRNNFRILVTPDFFCRYYI
jgi:hypothetical protein